MGMILRWIFGIVLACLLTMGLAFLVMHHGASADMNNLTAFQYWVVYLTVPSVAFGLFVFLSCAFVPSHKRRAALLVIGLGVTLVGFGIYQHSIDNGFLPSQYIVRYSGFMAGLATGFLVSYRTFKANNWA